AHGGIGDEELLGKFLLGHPQLLAPLLDISAEGLFVLHIYPLLDLGLALQDCLHHRSCRERSQANPGNLPLDRWESSKIVRRMETLSELSKRIRQCRAGTK